MRSLFVALVVPALLGTGVWLSTRKARQPSAAAAPVPTRPPPARRPAPPAPDPGFVGVILAGETIELEPKTEGRVLSILVKPGDEVARGTEIAHLDVGSLEHELTMARAALGRASRRLARRVPLLSRGFSAVTQEELEGARLEAVSQKAKVAQLSATIAEARIVAPTDGTVAARYLSPGALAGPGRPLVRLNGRGEPRVRFAVPEQLGGTIVVGGAVTVRISARDLATWGTVVLVAPEVDISSRMIYATATLAAPPELRAALATGLIARVFAGREPRAAALPAATSPGPLGAAALQEGP